ncbi:MAG: T9SS type A sorting domain-containing protein [Sphingobacteriales bacterium]|nr:T9SS type A sorting domain-containing protein [Sphingobacteriales bacterium]
MIKNSFSLVLQLVIIAFLSFFTPYANACETPTLAPACTDSFNDCSHVVQSGYSYHLAWSQVTCAGYHVWYKCYSNGEQISDNPDGWWKVTVYGDNNNYKVLSLPYNTDSIVAKVRAFCGVFNNSLTNVGAFTTEGTYRVVKGLIIEDFLEVAIGGTDLDLSWTLLANVNPTKVCDENSTAVNSFNNFVINNLPSTNYSSRLIQINLLRKSSSGQLFYFAYSNEPTEVKGIAFSDTASYDTISSALFDRLKALFTVPNPTYAFNTITSIKKTFPAAAIYVRLRRVAVSSSKMAMPENSLAEPSVKIYPNPANNLITLQTPNCETSVLMLYDTFGNLVKTADLIDTCSTQLDISDLNTGIYVGILVTNGQRSKPFRLAKIQ